MQFLSGLDSTFNQVKSHILLMEPLPNVRAAFSIIYREESNQKNGSLNSNTARTQTQNSAFVAKTGDQKRFKGKNTNLQCKHCGLKGHTIERCYKLIGFPKDFKSKNDVFNSNKTVVSNNASSENLSSGSSDQSDRHYLSSQEYNRFLSLIGSKHEGEEVNANMAGTSFNSVIGSCCNSQFSESKWVIDSGANQHMTSNDFELVNTVDVSKLNLKVDHPNGSTAEIKKIGNLQMSDSVTLFDVFVVPEFNVNLLSVHKLCKDNKCEVKFNEHSCSVQGLQSKVTVGDW